MKGVIKTTGIIIGLAALIAAGVASLNRDSQTSAEIFRVSPVEKGDLRVTITATGTVEPEEVIDVGAQVAGRIVSFGEDRQGKPIDYGSVVKAGDVLARIDDALYVSDVDHAKASLAQARANLERAQADLGQLEAKLEQARNDWKRAQQLGPSDALSQSSYDAYKAGFETAKANLAVGQATIAQNRGAVLQAVAALARAQRNLGYTTIVSPVDGTIIDRRVNIGQTVVASLNAPSLFLIAKDLRHMQVWVAVNEADIASIHPGQQVTFTVDAHPGRAFYGKVGKIRLNASMTQNVVTYTVEVLTDNSDLVLLPYLTANVQFEVASKSNVLTVPTGALRWTPAQDQIDPSVAGNLETVTALARADVSDARPLRTTGGAKSATLWVQSGNSVRPVFVYAGLSDGVRTEIEGDGIKEGMQVVIGSNADERESETRQGPSNPFTPQIRRGRARGASPH